MSGTRRPLQFQVRTLLLGVFVVSIPLALICWRLRMVTIQDRAIESARTKIATCGGVLDKGLVDGDFYVALQNRQITDEQLIDIAQDFQRFPGPWFDQRHTIVLDVSGNPITDDAIPHLLGVNFLSVNLASTLITDRSIPELERLTLMKRLNISDTQISEAGADRLRESFRDRTLVCEGR